jgi:Uma2 family endonuclease
MSITLEDFLNSPDTKPASEYIAGQVIQKPMSLGKHSLIRSELMMAINQPDIMLPFSELRCVFADYAVVPDLAVFKYENIPCDVDGTVANEFNLAPDWIIEILSLEQSASRLIEKILYCLCHGTVLGWLIDIEERSIFVCHTHEHIELINDPIQKITVPDFAGSISLTTSDIFGWLKL